MEFSALVGLGLRETHTVLDVGCSSLRLGRFLLVYLAPGKYYAVEPNRWLVDAGVEHEVTPELVAAKKPHFSNDSSLTPTIFGREFDYLVSVSVFSHAPRYMIEHCLREARQAMT